MKEFRIDIFLKRNRHTTEKHTKLPSMQRLKTNYDIIYLSLGFADQPGHQHSLISTFVIHFLESTIQEKFQFSS